MVRRFHTSRSDAITAALVAVATINATGATARGVDVIPTVTAAPTCTQSEIDELNRRMAAAILIQAIEDATDSETMDTVKEAIRRSYEAERELRRTAFRASKAR
jgi:hypothetical protein